MGILNSMFAKKKHPQKEVGKLRDVQKVKI